MVVTVIDTAGQAVPGAEISLQVQGGDALGVFQNGEVALVEVGKDVDWSAAGGPITVPLTGTKHVDCTPLVIQSGVPGTAGNCTFEVQADEHTTVTIYGGPSNLEDKAELTYPLGTRLSWYVRCNGIAGPWRVKPVDCTDLDATNSVCDMKINAPANTSVEIYGGPGSYQGGLPAPIVTLPIGVTISYRVTVNGATGPWLTKPIDCTDLDISVGTEGGGDEVCNMAIIAPANVAVELYGVSGGPYHNTDSVDLPMGITVSWRATVSGATGPWFTKKVDCTALNLTGGTTPGGIDICDMLIRAPLGVSVELYGVSGGPFLGGATVSLPVGITVSWRASINGITGPWNTKPVDCTSLDLSHGGPGAEICDMQIQADRGVTVEIYGVAGTYQNGDMIQIPNGASLSWRAKFGSTTTGWQTKKVDCTPLVAECNMKVIAPAGAKVQINYVGTFVNGDTVPLKMGKTYSWRAWANNIYGPWTTKLIDCTPLDATSAFCNMAIDVPEGDEAVFGKHGAKVQINYVGTYTDGDRVLLPNCATVSWRAWVNNLYGPWDTKHVECTALDASEAICVADIVTPTGPPEVVGPQGAKVQINYVGTYQNGDQVALPTGATISHRGWANNIYGPWNTQTIACPSTIAPSFCEMAIVAAAGTKVQINYVGTYVGGNSVLLPIGANVSYRGWANNIYGPWNTKHIDCSALDSGPGEGDPFGAFCDMEIDALRGIDIQINYVGTYHDNDHVTLPIGATVSWRAKVNGHWTGWQTKMVDCSALAAECEILIRTLPGTAVGISGVGTFDDGESASAKMGSTIKWQAKSHGVAGPWNTKLVDCTPIDATDEYCDMAILVDPAIEEDVQVGINGIGTYRDGAVVVLPIGGAIKWQAKAHGVSGPWHDKPIDCNPIQVSLFDGQGVDDFCEVAILVPEEDVRSEVTVGPEHIAARN